MVAEAKLFGDQAIEFFFFAGLMFVFILVFLLFVRSYNYIEDLDVKQQQDNMTFDHAASDGDIVVVEGEEESVKRRHGNVTYQKVTSHEQ